MTVGLCTLEIFLPAAQSLKDKRQAIRGLLDRLRSRHNVSAAEVEHQDLWQRAGIAIAAVASSRKPLEPMFESILAEIERTIPGYVTSHEIDYL